MAGSIDRVTKAAADAGLDIVLVFQGETSGKLFLSWFPAPISWI
ncbi:hypothetical protein [Mesorhizobium sp. M1393]